MPLPSWGLDSKSSEEAEKAAISSEPRRCLRKPMGRRKPKQETPYQKPISHSKWKMELADEILDNDDEDELDCLSSFERG